MSRYISRDLTFVEQSLPQHDRVESIERLADRQYLVNRHDLPAVTVVFLHEYDLTVQRENLALHDREIDLDWMEPTGLDGPCTSTRFGYRCYRCSTARAPRCDEPLSTIQNTRRAGTIGRTRHDLLDQVVEGGDPSGGFAAAKESGVMHIQGGPVGPGAVDTEGDSCFQSF